MATNPFDQFDDQPVPDSRLPVVPRANYGSGGADDDGMSPEELKQANYQQGFAPGGPLKVLIDGGAAPANDTNPFDQFDEGGDTAIAPAEAPPEAPAPLLGQQALDATRNTVGGLAQGYASAVDIPANALGAVMGEAARYGAKAVGGIADMFGYDGEAIRNAGREAAGNFYNPITLGGMIEQAAPTPEDGVGKSVRFVSQLAGGLKAVPGMRNLPEMFGMKAAPSRVLPKELTEGQAVGAAAERIGAKVLPADVGGPFTRRMTAAAVQTPLGAGPVVKAAQVATESVKSAAQRTADKAGRVLDPEDAGDLVHQGVKAYSKNTSRIGGKLYQRAEQLAGEAKVNPAMAKSALMLHIDELAETPETNAAALKVLNSLESDLSKPLSVAAVRRLRTNTRAAIMKEGLRGSDVERRVGEVLDSASADIVASIPKPAAAAYKAADEFWKQRVEQIDTILAPIVGRKGEKGSTAAFTAIERLARTGDAKKLSKLMSSLSEEDSGSITATIIHRLGEASPGAQDAIGGAFSPATFLTNWNKISPKAKGVLFNPELRSALNDLATVTGGMKEASRYANAPQTGGAIAGLASMGAASQIFAHPVLSSMFFGVQYGTGRLMASPAFVRHLTKIARVSPQAGPSVLRTRILGLSEVAAREPLLAKDIAAVQQSMLKGLNDNAVRTGSAAASPDQGPDQH